MAEVRSNLLWMDIQFHALKLPFRLQQGARRMNRTLTQRYDMNALRALQKLETQIVEKVCQQMGIEEDDLDIEVDLLRVYNMDAAEREGELVSILVVCASFG